MAFATPSIFKQFCILKLHYRDTIITIVIKAKFLFLLTLFLLFGCVTKNPYNEPLPPIFPYYGFLEGDKYEIYESHEQFDFSNKVISFDIADSRGANKSIQCVDYDLDRNTELEGNVGMNLVSEYFGRSLQNSHAKLDIKSATKLSIEVEGLSFRLKGIGQITVHGIVQLRAHFGNFEKTYCVDITDKGGDPYSPLKWYSFDTRVGASRKMVSAAIRKAVDQVLMDVSLQNN